MGKIIEFYRHSDAIHVHKENGTDVSYFIFDEYEIHRNIMKAHTIQEWHYHSKIDESLFVVKGELTAYWIEEGHKKKEIIHPNEIVRVKQSVHTFENETDEDIEFIVFRFVPDHVDKKDIIKNDKFLWEEL